MGPLHERLRPMDFGGVVGQDKAVNTCRRMIAAGLGGRAFFISGASGTGKSCIAELLAREIADPICIEELDAGGLTRAQVQECERASHYRGLGVKDGRAWIINECHALRPEAVRQLLVTLDSGRIPSHVIWVLTTTSDGQEKLFADEMDAHPLLSRCTRIALTRQGLAKPFASYCRRVAQAEGLDGRPEADYVTLLQKHKNNLRAALMEIEAGGMLPD